MKATTLSFRPGPRLWLCLVLLFAAAFGAQARPVPVPAMKSRVIDQSRTLDTAQAEALRERIADIERETQAQLAVLIVPTTGKDSIEQYATRVFAQWKLGRKDEDDGVLLLVAIRDRRMRIEVGRGLEGRITDIQAARIIDQEMTPRFRASDFDGGLHAAVDGIAQLIRGEPMAMAQELPLIDPGEPVESTPPEPRESHVTPEGWAFFAVIGWSALVGLWQSRQKKSAAELRTDADRLARRRARQARSSARRSTRRARRAQAEVAAELESASAVAEAAPGRTLRRWPWTFGALAVAPVAAAATLGEPMFAIALGMMPVPMGFGIGYGCGLWRTMRLVVAGIALLIAAVVIAGQQLGWERVGWSLLGMLALGAAVLVGLLIVTGMRKAWGKGVRSFVTRWIVVCVLVGLFVGLAHDELDPPLFWIVLAAVTVVALLVAFFPADGGGGGHDGDYGDSGWGSSSSSSSSSSYESSSSSSSDSSSSSSSDSGGSSSGGGASGSW